MTDLSIFYEVSLLLLLATAVGAVGLLLRQPLIVSFIAAGILAGPSGIGLSSGGEHVELLSQMGIAVLLFLVGIKLDVQLVRSLGLVSLCTGLGQVFFTSAFGFLIALAFGLDTIASIYVAVALTFSSTIIIVKLLSDKREIDSLHGRIALGFLIVQDLVVVLAMIVLSTIGIGSQQDAGATDILKVVGAGVVMVGAVGLFVRYLANPVTWMLARAPELLIIFAVCQATLFAAVADFFGLGKELGGLMAGVSLASTPYREAVVARLSPLRDFLLLFFFISLGSHLDLGNIGNDWPAALVFSAFVLIGNPLIVMIIMGFMGYRKRTGFLAGLTVAQISEFSLVFMAMGLSIGHVTPDSVGLVTIVGLITIAASTYMITYSHRLYGVLEPLLYPFERQVTSEPMDESRFPQGGYDVLVFGLGRYGTAVAQRLKKQGMSVLGIDFNPEAVAHWRQLGFAAIYGDASDPEFVGHLPLQSATWAVSAIPYHDIGLTHMDPRIGIMGALRDARFKGNIAVACHRQTDLDVLRKAGADLVLLPFQDAADQAADLLMSTRRPPRFDLPEPGGQKDIPA